MVDELVGVVTGELVLVCVFEGVGLRLGGLLVLSPLHATDKTTRNESAVGMLVN